MKAVRFPARPRARAQKARQAGRNKEPTRCASPPGRNANRPDRPPRSTIAFPRTTSVPGVKDRRIEAVVALIENRLERGVSVSELAAGVGLSRSRLEHMFRGQVGSSIRTYVEAVRLARAEGLLRDLRLSVKEIATRCGYASTSSLTREFKRRLGLSPSEYRRSTPG